MNYKDIKTFTQRCEEHPDHQQGMVSYDMLQQRLWEEIEELRAYIENRKWVGLTEEEVTQAMYRADAIFTGPMQFKFAKELEAKLKEKNT